MSATIDCRLLGPPQVTVGGDPLDVDTRKAIGLLALVVVEGWVTRDRAAALLWSESSEPRAKAALRRTLSTLTTGLSGRAIVADRQRIELIDDDVASDVQALTVGANRLSVDELVALRRGPFLDGFRLRGASGFDAWMRDTARHLDQRWLGALDEAIAAVRSDDDARLERLAQARLSIEPVHERTHALLIRLAGRRGDRDLVVSRYRDCVAVLRNELGVGPRARTTRLYEDALTGTLDATPTEPEELARVDQDVLAVLSLTGRPLPVPVLRGVTAASDEDLAASIDRLTAAGRVKTVRDAIEMIPRRDRARVAADLGPVRRTALHRRLARALQGLAGHEDSCAFHLEAAGMPSDAAAAWEAAAHRAADTGSWEEARHDLEKALAAGHPDTARLWMEIGDIDLRRGRYDEARDAYAAAIVDSSGTQTAVLERRLGLLQVRRQQWGAAVVHLHAARSAGLPVGAELALATWHFGDHEQAETFAHQVLDEATDRGVADDVIAARNVLGLLARRNGDLDAAEGHLAAGIALAATGHPVRAALLNNLGLVRLDQELWEHAEARFAEALEEAQAAGDLHHEAAILSNLADTAHAAGDQQRARDLVRESATRLALVGGGTTGEPDLWTVQDW